MTTFDPSRFLPDALLERIRERAPIHDRDNTSPSRISPSSARPAICRSSSRPTAAAPD